MESTDATDKAVFIRYIPKDLIIEIHFSNEIYFCLKIDSARNLAKMITEACDKMTQ